MIVPSLPGSGEPASSCPNGGLGPPRLRDRVELATVSTSLWATVVTMGYARTVEVERPKPRPPSLPHRTISTLPARGSCPALQPQLSRVQPAPPRLQGITLALALPLPHGEGVRRTSTNFPAGVWHTPRQASSRRVLRLLSSFFAQGWSSALLTAWQWSCSPSRDASARASPPCEHNTCPVWTRRRGVPASVTNPNHRIDSGNFSPSN